MSKKTQAKSSKKGIIIGVSLVLAVAIIAGVLLFDRFVDYSDDFREQIALKSENYTVSTAMMNYLFNSNYMQFQSQLDSSKSLKEQKYTEDSTMFDFLLEYTLNQARQMLVLCEGAKAEGFSDRKSVV